MLSRHILRRNLHLNLHHFSLRLYPCAHESHPDCLNASLF
ncbi:hypothetical protein NT04LM_3868 [Listeria monocytogenes FSL F2-208]|nr:hypothetical protein NT04LM_3868 [Listeria monocytogenes FSL F2-208]